MFDPERRRAPRLMRRSRTFLLTLLLDDGDGDAVRGRVRLVATGQEALFTSLEELLRFLRAGGDDLPPAGREPAAEP